jgi:phosphoglycolate phosphatase-like HAD superfamily hydrolase
MTDFDGVVLESESAKFQGFYDCFSIFPEKLDVIMEYMRAHDDLNRYEKFRYIFEVLLKQQYTLDIERWIIGRCNKCVHERVVSCPEVPGIIDFLKMCNRVVPVCVISGTPTDQLERILEDRGITDLFHELHGIPPKKSQILHGILERYHVSPEKSVYIGDRNSDLEAARENRIPFIARINDEVFSAATIYQCRDFMGIKSLFDINKEDGLLFLITDE